MYSRLRRITWRFRVSLMVLLLGYFCMHAVAQQRMEFESSKNKTELNKTINLLGKSTNDMQNLQENNFMINLIGTDSIGVKDSVLNSTLFDPTKVIANKKYKYTGKNLLLYGGFVVPALLIGTGLIGLESDWLKYQNHEIRNELQENIDRKMTLDDISQYMPMVAVYGLNLAGIKGKHNFRDRTMILATSYLMMGITVEGLKNITRVERPDGSSRNSFPSGHTATAFMGAEFLWQEYKDVSPWIGVAGYTIAAGTGFFRMYNNRHWLNDVLAGAGIGILSSKIAYLSYPYIQKKLFGGTRLKNVSAVPFYSKTGKGLTCMITF